MLLDGLVAVVVNDQFSIQHAAFNFCRSPYTYDVYARTPLPLLDTCDPAALAKYSFTVHAVRIMLLEGLRIQSVPDDLEALTKLKHLRLSNNQISGFRGNIYLISSLETLDLGHNRWGPCRSEHWAQWALGFIEYAQTVLCVDLIVG